MFHSVCESVLLCVDVCCLLCTCATECSGTGAPIIPLRPCAPRYAAIARGVACVLREAHHLGRNKHERSRDACAHADSMWVHSFILMCLIGQNDQSAATRLPTMTWLHRRVWMDARMDVYAYAYAYTYIQPAIHTRRCNHVVVGNLVAGRDG